MGYMFTAILAFLLSFPVLINHDIPVQMRLLFLGVVSILSLFIGCKYIDYLNLTLL